MLSDAGKPIAVSSVPALLEQAASAFPDHNALDFFGRKLTYTDLAHQVDRAARGFQRLGVVHGTRVGLCLPNTPYFVIAYFAVLKAGGIVVNFNPLQVAREIARQIEDSGTTIMVTLDVAKIYPKIAEALETTSLEKVVICSLCAALPTGKGLLFRLFKARELARIPRNAKHVRFEKLFADRTPMTPVTINPVIDLAVLQYTGGTTGVPKGAMLSHANLTANVAQIIDRVPVLRPGQESAIVLLPLFHVFGMTTSMNLCVALGFEMILLPSLDLPQLLKLIVSKKPTLFPGVPSLFATLSNMAEHGTFDLSSIRFCISGGAPLPLETRQRFETLTGCKLIEGYGLTEASPVVAANPLDAPYKNESVGPPLKETIVEIRSLDDPMKILRAGERGEICLRGPQIMAGYWRNLQETKAAFVEGALRTGDVGYLDQDGDLFLVDRIKDIIICNGFKIYPRAIEEALVQHPAVDEAVAIGIADAVRGHVPKAFVTLLPGAATTPDMLLEFLKTHLSRLEMPRVIEIRAALPKTNIGKISRKDLVLEEERLHAVSE
ncbi:MAG: long-chain fatty acid--CoA ligase [Methylovirgula sp.]|uniref:long-chain-fatty-acid--CoA ligase n=1 Tax=Methylovirgula sp. TaxID=1978224 RepID=UPI0030762DC6